MQVLLTGASSFTGYWFAAALANAGHQVAATFTRSRESDYEGTLKGRRIALLKDMVTPIYGCCFGDAQFLTTLSRTQPDVLCHHGAEVTDYKSQDFDYQAAFGTNTNAIRDVISALKEGGCNKIVLTGSVFESGEGEGSDGLPSFSPYGLSKALTSATFAYFCWREQLSLGMFVIPNPFGPLEEVRFTSYLIRCWRAAQPALVRTPDYVRDNIHVSLLARAYVAFVTRLSSDPGATKLNPSEYPESQREFAERFAAEIGSRLGWNTALEFADQTEFSEPLVRVNTDQLNAMELDWNETRAWDDLAKYYASADG